MPFILILILILILVVLPRPSQSKFEDEDEQEDENEEDLWWCPNLMVGMPRCGVPARKGRNEVTTMQGHECCAALRRGHRSAMTLPN
jgi:hypothetical protein